MAAVFRGTLVGDPRVTVVTRYELRACEPGVRVRTDLYNGAPDPNTLYITDGYFWGDHGMAPFVPGPGLGFRAPEIDLTEISTAWREWPFLAARSQAAPDLAYASIPCDRSTAAGFNDPTLTSAGIPLVTTLPGDGVHFERYLVATPGAGLAPAVREALHVRAMVHDEPEAVTVTGTRRSAPPARSSATRDRWCRCCSTSRGLAPIPTTRRAACRGARPSPRWTEASR